MRPQGLAVAGLAADRGRRLAPPAGRLRHRRAADPARRRRRGRQARPVLPSRTTSAIDPAGPRLRRRQLQPPDRPLRAGADVQVPRPLGRVRHRRGPAAVPARPGRGRDRAHVRRRPRRQPDRRLRHRRRLAGLVRRLRARRRPVHPAAGRRPRTRAGRAPSPTPSTAASCC